MDLPNVPRAPDFNSLGLPDRRPTHGVDCSFTKLFESLEPGLHLAVNGYLNAYWHHGIYVGKRKRTVKLHVIVDMWGRDKSSARIQKRSLDDFLRVQSVFALFNTTQRILSSSELEQSSELLWPFFREPLNRCMTSSPTIANASRSGAPQAGTSLLPMLIFSLKFTKQTWI